MCGLFCVYDSSGSIKQYEESIIKAGELLFHRGPDDHGFYADDYFAVYFRRLSIIDTTLAGRQPMLSDDKNYIIAFNGEIYNYKELRCELQKRGYQFRSNSDTEVLLKSYQEFGTRCVESLRGMFAFIIWNKSEKKLFGFRDRLGIKPLFICYNNTQTILSSEIKSILSYVPQKNAPNERTIFKYLSRGWLDDTTDTFYKEINSLPSATTIEITSEGTKKNKYWTLSINDSKLFNASEFRVSFFETISQHLMSDVPIAVTLSGGLDSTSITAVASQLVSNSYELSAFSVIPPDTIDESFWIDKAVSGTKITHSYPNIDFNKAPEMIEEILRTQDEPFHSVSCIYQYLLREKIANNGIKVLLVGEGGDEALGGYVRFIYPYLYSLLEDKRTDLFNAALEGAEVLLGITTDKILIKLNAYKEMLQNGGCGQENMSAYSLLDRDYTEQYSEVVNEPAYPTIIGSCKNYFFAHLFLHLFTRDIPYVLRMEDRYSMAHGIEARVPFLDHKFLEHIFSYDYSEFMKNGKNKAMLRDSLRDYLPSEVINRKSKSGRPGSNAHIVFGVLKQNIQDMLKSKELKSVGYWHNKCHSIFQQDCLTRNDERAIVWFRSYILMKWFKLNYSL